MSAARDVLSFAVQPIVVSVLPDGTPAVDQPTTVIWSTHSQEVRWVAADPKTVFHICFKDKSPFDKGRHFHSSDGRSGKITAGASGSYDYSVEINGKILDPTVVIKP